MTGNACLAQDGQDIMLTPLERIPIDLRISYPAFISSTGSED